ncbi:MAG: hypothetical protein IJT59_02850 [Desulfovibrionaceae bacterium]|nr:hypothetical protein [Desulfovibrionaceae bacterium]
MIDAKILGLKNIKKYQLEQLSSSPEAVHKLANLEIAKLQKLHAKELSILSRKLDALVATGTKTEADKNAILDRRKKRQQKNMDKLCTKLFST